MKLYKTPISFSTQEYFFNSFLGSLLCRPINDVSPIKKQLSKKVMMLLENIDAPYKLKQTKHSESTIKTSRFIKLYAKTLVFICKHSFFLAFLFAKIRIPVFENAAEAIAIFRECTNDKNQSDLCLPRSFFAVSTSKKFKKSGVMFIGVFLPSRSMHAWVIEDNCQPDWYDGIWINFQPVAVFIF
jgi:hypothetical protein